MVAGSVAVALGVTVVPAGAAATGPAASGSVHWRSCGDGFECGQLAVPVDDADPTGPTLDVAVIRRPARDRKARRGALVLNPGGPGMSGVEFLRSAADGLPGAVQDAYDLVSFDPRGVGGTSPVSCVDSLDPLFDEQFSPTDAAARDGLTRAFRRVAAACAANNGDLLSHVSTRATAHDLDRLRAALGERRLDYVGYSYGTYLGALYAQDFPDRVGRFVLDGPVDPSLDGAATTLSQARGFERSLDDFLAWCAKDDPCSFRHGGHTARAYDSLRASVAKQPVAAKDQPGRTLDETRFDAAVLELLYGGRASWRTLERALTSTEDGNSSTLLSVADSYVGRQSDGHDDNTLEAFWAISCLDGPVIGDVAATAALEAKAARVAPRLGPFVVNNSLACSVWPVPALPPTGPIVAPGTPTVLVVGTTRDPATPYEQATALAGQLQHGVLLTVKGSRHTSFASGNACADRVITGFLVRGVVPATGTTC